MVSGDLGEEEDREVEGDRSARIELMASVVGEVTSVCLTDGTVDVDAGVLGGLQSTRWSSRSARSSNGWLQRSHQQFNTSGEEDSAEEHERSALQENEERRCPIGQANSSA